jgi:CRISPR/Cas system CMR-associated protein Cmr3 (group 5 of RAMP superfamily)
MKYYKAINVLGETDEKHWSLNEIENISDFDVKKMNYSKQFDFEGEFLLSVDLDFGSKEIDFNLCDSGIQIVSEKLRNLLSCEDAIFYPVKFTNFNPASKYYALRIRNFYDCVDESKSDIRYWNPENTAIKERFGNYENLGRFVLDESKIGTAHIFRLQKYFPAIIISEILMKSFFKNCITGIGFLDSWTLKTTIFTFN